MKLPTCLVVFALATPASAALVDPVTNGSFEAPDDPDAPTLPADWGTFSQNEAEFDVTYVTASNDAFDGDDFMRISSEATTNVNLNINQNITDLNQIVAGSEGTELKVRFAFRAQNADVNDIIRVRVRSRPELGAPFDQTDFLVDLEEGENGWTVYETPTFTLPEGTTVIAPLALFLDGRGGLNAGFQDASPGDPTTLDLDAVSVVVPEPGSLGFAASGLLLMVMRRRRAQR